MAPWNSNGRHTVAALQAQVAHLEARLQALEQRPAAAPPAQVYAAVPLATLEGWLAQLAGISTALQHARPAPLTDDEVCLLAKFRHELEQGTA